MDISEYITLHLLYLYIHTCNDKTFRLFLIDFKSRQLKVSFFNPLYTNRMVGKVFPWQVKIKNIKEETVIGLNWEPISIFLKKKLFEPKK